MAQTIDQLWLRLEARSAYFWEVPGAMFSGWKPMLFPLRSWNPFLAPLVAWFGLIRLKMIRVQPTGPATITYAVVDGPPRDWRGLRIFDLDTGTEIKEVLEADTVNGWVVRYVTDAQGRIVPNQHGDRAKTEIIRGRFEIRRPD